VVPDANRSTLCAGETYPSNELIKVVNHF